MFDRVKISMIIPVYNIRDYIAKCLDSVCRQRYADIEILIVDDCSTDGSGDICDRYAREDKRIKVIRHTRNMGLSAARNTGMENATGNFYMFVDGDDWIDSELCQNAAAILKANQAKADTVHWGYRCVNEEGEQKENVKPIMYPQNIIVPPQIFDDFMSTLVVSLKDLNNWFASGKSYYEAIHSRKQMATVWRYLLSAEVIRKNGLQFSLHAGRGEDIVFMLSYLQLCKGIINLDTENAYFYQQREGSLITDQNNISKKIELIEAMEETVRFAPDNRKEELRDKWRGQRILVVMNTARRLAKVSSFIAGYRDYAKVAKHPISQDAVKRLRIKNIPFKYKIAIGLIKYRMYFLFWLCIYLMQKLHIDMAPMD